MTHYGRTASIMIAVSLSIACDKAADDQQKANNAQTNANTKITTANNEAAREGQAAQEAADKSIAEATQHFTQLRDDYRRDTTKALAVLDSKVRSLESQAQSSTPGSKVEIDARLATIRDKRNAFDTDYRVLESTSAPTWDATKARLDGEMSDLTAMVDKAPTSELSARSKARPPVGP